jgi:hypothetical protein
LEAKVLESNSQPFSYPSSSKRPIKNWDDIEPVEADETKEQEKNIEKYFQDLYASSSDDVKKAMMKSFVIPLDV